MISMVAFAPGISQYNTLTLVEGLINQTTIIPDCISILLHMLKTSYI